MITSFFFLSLSMFSFHQSPWLAPYICFNNEQRRQSTDLVSKDFFKLLNNSAYGKFGENLRGRETVHIVKDANIFRRKVAKSNFYSTIILSPDCALVRCQRTSVELNKPIYLTGVVLDKAKLRMNHFWYFSLKKAFDIPPCIGLTLHMTDTDSYIFSVRTPPGTGVAKIWNQFASIAESLDISTYSEDHPFFLYNPDLKDALLAHRSSCKGKLGLFKDELGNGVIKTGIFLKPKIYSLDAYKHHTPMVSSSSLETQSSNTYEIKKLKGISRSVVANDISHSSYLKALEDEMPQRHTMTTITSRQHTLYIEELTKSTLSLFDDKRFWKTKYVSQAYGL